MNVRNQCLCVILALGLAAGCDSNDAPVQQAAPMSEDVPPLRNIAFKLLITSNLTYTAKDETLARENLPGLVVDRLNIDGSADGNSFSIANGEAQNFTLEYTIQNDGNNRFSGNVRMSGWGQGYISTLYSGEYTFSNGVDLINSLSDKAYAYIHTGWHDARKDAVQK